MDYSFWVLLLGSGFADVDGGFPEEATLLGD